MADSAVSIEDGIEFESFFRVTEPLLRRALVAGFGSDLGRDAAAEALAYGWRNWSRVSALANPAGYLYRVGERWAQRHRQRPQRWFAATAVQWDSPFEPGLAAVLAELPRRQRQVVVLVTGFGLSHRETAELLDISRSSVQNHVERALHTLRTRLGAQP